MQTPYTQGAESISAGRERAAILRCRQQVLAIKVETPNSRFWLAKEANGPFSHNLNTASNFDLRRRRHLTLLAHPPPHTSPIMVRQTGADFQRNH
jgi:hypothetical protein